MKGWEEGWWNIVIKRLASALIIFVLLFTMFAPFRAFADQPVNDWFPRTSQFTHVAYGNGTYVAVGYEGFIWISKDGVHWNWIPQKLDDYGYTFFGDVTYANGMFVVVGMGGTVLTSPDGINWTLRIKAADILQSVTYGDGTFVAVGYNGCVDRKSVV